MGRFFGALVGSVLGSLLLPLLGRFVGISWDNIIGFIFSWHFLILLAVTFNILRFFGWLLKKGSVEQKKEEKKEERKEAIKKGLYKIKKPNILDIKARLNTDGIAVVLNSISESVLTVITDDVNGSGFVIGKGGWVMTNWHVVEDRKYVRLKFPKKEDLYMGKVVISNEKRDVALIKMEEKAGGGDSLSVDFSLPQVGNDVYAVGTPLAEEYEGTVTKGIISAIRTKDGLPFIQSDISINPGNSGGPLLDKYGNVIGVAVSGIGSIDTGLNAGLNFFIPIKSAIESIKITTK